MVLEILKRSSSAQIEPDLPVERQGRKNRGIVEKEKKVNQAEFGGGRSPKPGFKRLRVPRKETALGEKTGKQMTEKKSEADEKRIPGSFRIAIHIRGAVHKENGEQRTGGARGIAGVDDN